MEVNDCVVILLNNLHLVWNWVLCKISTCVQFLHLVLKQEGIHLSQRRKDCSNKNRKCHWSYFISLEWQRWQIFIAQ